MVEKQKEERKDYDGLNNTETGQRNYGHNLLYGLISALVKITTEAEFMVFLFVGWFVSCFFYCGLLFIF